jgi:acyl carrier protein
MGLKRQPMENKFIELISYVLELDDRIPELGDRFDTYAEWDSLAQLTLIAELDEQFGVTIKGSELRSMETVGDLYRRILAETPNE